MAVPVVRRRPLRRASAVLPRPQHRGGGGCAQRRGTCLYQVAYGLRGRVRHCGGLGHGDDVVRADTYVIEEPIYNMQRKQIQHRTCCPPARPPAPYTVATPKPPRPHDT